MISATLTVAGEVVATWSESAGLVADPPWRDLIEAQLAIGGGMPYEAMPELEAFKRVAEEAGTLAIIGEPDQLPADAVP